MSVGDKRVLQSLIKLMASNAEKVSKGSKGVVVWMLMASLLHAYSNILTTQVPCVLCKTPTLNPPACIH